MSIQTINSKSAVKKTRGRIWRWLMFLTLAGASLLLLVASGAWLFLNGSLPQLNGTQAVAGLQAPVKVMRDQYGVPLIKGIDREDLAYATGFVHAQDRFFQMDLLRRVGAGELAELFGPGAVAIDKAHRLHRFRARAERVLNKMLSSERQFLERYVDGVNDGLKGLTTRPFEYVLIGTTPRIWTSADSLLVVWAMYFDLHGDQIPRKLARGWLKENCSPAQLAFLLPQSSQWDAPLDSNESIEATVAIPVNAPNWWTNPIVGSVEKSGSAERTNFFGSNNWAIAGTRSKNGAAIVSNDMHLGIRLPNTWYRLGLQFSEAGVTKRIVGVSLPGMPLVVVGSNGHVAWGFTNSYGDFLDLIDITENGTALDPAKKSDAREIPLKHTEVIHVKNAPDDRLEVFETSLGPLRKIGGRDYIIHWVADTDESVNLNGRKLEFSDTLADAMAVATTIGTPAQNFVVGDDKGHIGWTIAGYVPRRSQADFLTTFPMNLSNNYSAWAGRLPPAKYPRISNPKSGQLWTANSRQLMGVESERLGDGGYDLGARSRQIRDSLFDLGKMVELKSANAIALDDRAIFLSQWRDRAILALDAKAIAKHPDRAHFLQILKKNWSGHANVESVAYTITRSFMFALYDIAFSRIDGEMSKLDAKSSMALATSRWPVVLARLIDEQSEGWLPARYPNWQSVQLSAIDRVIADMTKNGRSLDSATWGERNVATISHPFGAAVPFIGRWLSAPGDKLAGDSNMPRVAGPNFGQSERMTVSPGREEEGVFNMPGGQSGHPLSPFFLKGHQDWVVGRPLPLLPGEPIHIFTFVNAKKNDN